MSQGTGFPSLLGPQFSLRRETHPEVAVGGHLMAGRD